MMTTNSMVSEEQLLKFSTFHTVLEERKNSSSPPIFSWTDWNKKSGVAYGRDAWYREMLRSKPMTLKFSKTGKGQGGWVVTEPDDVAPGLNETERTQPWNHKYQISMLENVKVFWIKGPLKGLEFFISKEMNNDHVIS
jgi:hypothetical protein